MLVIRCPYCLELRHEDELVYGGETDVVRPPDPNAVSNAQWCDYLYLRTNGAGRIHEQWCCAAGCGQWFKVARDSVTQTIARVACMHETLDPAENESDGRGR